MMRVQNAGRFALERALVFVAVTACIVACSSTSTTPTVTVSTTPTLTASPTPNTTATPIPLPTSTTITLSIESLATPSGVLLDPVIYVSVGGSRSIPVIFDSGSVGLHVTQSALLAYGASYPTAAPGSGITAGYGGTGASTCTFTGYHTVAPITIGTIALPSPAPFDVILNVSSGCTGLLSSGIVNGILGVRPGLPSQNDYSALPNLMQLLPGNLASGFIVSLYQSTPMVTVGLPSPLPSGFTTVQPIVQPAPYPSTVYWDTTADSASTYTQGAFSWCIYVAPPSSVPSPAPTISTCEQTAVTDSGAEGGRTYFDASPPPWISTNSVSGEAGVASAGTAPPGTTITATLNGTGFTFSLPVAAASPGDCLGYNNMTLLFGSVGTPTGAEENFGLSPFFENDIMYDFQGKNLFGVRNAVPMPVVMPSPCQGTFTIQSR